MARSTDPTIHVPADLWSAAAQQVIALHQEAGGIALVPNARGRRCEITIPKVLIEAMRRGLESPKPEAE